MLYQKGPLSLNRKYTISRCPATQSAIIAGLANILRLDEHRRTPQSLHLNPFMCEPKPFGNCSTASVSNAVVRMKSKASTLVYKNARKLEESSAAIISNRSVNVMPVEASS